VHAGIELHPDGDGFGELCPLQRFQLLGTVHGGVQLLGRERGEIVSGKKTLQQQDRLSNAALTQLQGLFKTGNAKGVGIRERSRGLKETVSVSVRFHHCNQFAGGSQFAQALQIVSQSAAVDYYGCRLHVNPYKKKDESSKSFALQEGDKSGKPQELTLVSDWGERTQSTHLRREG